MGGRVTREMCGGGVLSAMTGSAGAGSARTGIGMSARVVPVRARELLGRADSLLAQASCVSSGRSSSGRVTPSDAAEMFRLAYVAAVRGAAAVLAVGGAVGGPGVGRSRSRNAWVMLSARSPEFLAWAEYFSAHSSARAAIEAGITSNVGADRAEVLLAETRRFLDDVEAYLDGVGRFDQAG